MVMEVSLQHTTLAFSGDEWAAFYITSVETRMDGSFDVAGQFLGCEDQSVVDLLRSMMRQSGGSIHICAA